MLGLSSLHVRRPWMLTRQIGGGDEPPVDPPVEPPVVSGNPLPASLTSGLISDLDPAMAERVTVVDGRLMQIIDRAGLYSAVAPVAGSEPLYLTDDMPRWRHGAVVTWSSIVPAVDWSMPITVVLVTTSTSTGSMAVLDIGDPAKGTGIDRWGMYTLNGSAEWRRSSSANGTITTGSTPTSITGTRHVLIATSTPGGQITLTASRDAPIQSTSVHGPAIPPVHVELGHRHANGTRGIRWHGDIYRALFWNRLLSTSERTALLDWSTGVYATP